MGVGVGASLVSNTVSFRLNAPVWRQHSDTRFLGKEKIRLGWVEIEDLNLRYEGRYLPTSGKYHHH